MVEESPPHRTLRQDEEETQQEGEEEEGEEEDMDADTQPMGYQEHGDNHSTMVECGSERADEEETQQEGEPPRQASRATQSAEPSRSLPSPRLQPASATQRSTQARPETRAATAARGESPSGHPAYPTERGARNLASRPTTGRQADLSAMGLVRSHAPTLTMVQGRLLVFKWKALILMLRARQAFGRSWRRDCRWVAGLLETAAVWDHLGGATSVQRETRGSPLSR